MVIDNNSTDDTRKYLEKLKSQHENVKIIFNKENVGFPAGVNQGILEAKTENIIVVNNDIVVTKGWLTKLLAVSASDENFGIVGPISNSVRGVQFDEKAIYKSF